MVGNVVRAALAALLWTALAAPYAAAQSSAAYTYDPLGRLKEAATDSGVTTYTYDLGNNRTRLQMSGNKLPVAVDDLISVAAGKQVSIDLVANDTDADNDTLSIHSVTPSAAPKGSFTPSGTIPAGVTTIVYSANANAGSQQDVLTYKVVDSKGGVSANSGTLRVNIVYADQGEIIPTTFTASSTIPSIAYTGLTTAGGMNDGDYGSNSSVHTTDSGSPSWIRADLGSVKSLTQVAVATVIGWGPNYVNGAALQYSLDGNTWNTALTLSGMTSASLKAFALTGVSARYVRLSHSGYLAIGDFRFYGTDGANPGPTAPTVNNVSQTVPAGQQSQINLSISGTYSSVAVYSPPAGGTAAVIGGNTIRYTPNSGTTSDSFRYTATNSAGTSAPAWITITVTGGGQAPVAGHSSTTVTAGSASNNLPLNITGGTPTSIALIAPFPLKGAAQAVGTQMFYTAQTGVSGSDFVYYSATNQFGTSTTGAITVNINAPQIQPPSVSNSSASVAHGSVNNILIPNLGGGAPTYMTIVSPPSKGQAVWSNNNIYYTPNSGAYGADSFTFSASNSAGTSGTATFNITIGAPPAPWLGNSSTSVGYGSASNVLPLNYLPGSGPATSWQVTAGPSKGWAEFVGGTLYYTPYPTSTGQDEVWWRASGPGGAAAPDGKVTITIGSSPSNLPPTAGSISAFTLQYGSTEAYPLNYSSDPDGDPLTVTAVSTTETSLAWYGVSNNTIYVTSKGPVGSETISYTISDGRGGTATGYLYLEVSP